MTDAEEFRGFPKATLAFLSELREHNNREWFQANKRRYEHELLGPALAFVEAIAPRLEEIAPQYLAEAKKSGGSLLRIYRDVRFSKDKTPYKTHLAMHFKHIASRRQEAPGFYVHFDPEGLFLGVGLHMPGSQTLGKLRQAIDGDPEAWLGARDDDAFRAIWKLRGEALKRAPRGYPNDHPLIDDIKRKSFTAVCEGSAEEVLAPDFLDRTAERFAAAVPFMAWLCRAVGVPF